MTIEKNYLHNEIFKGLTCEEATEYQTGKIKGVYHNGHIWEVISCNLSKPNTVGSTHIVYSIKIRKPCPSREQLLQEILERK